MYIDSTGQFVLPIFIAILATYNVGMDLVDVYHYVNVVRYPEGYTDEETVDAGAAVLEDMWTFGVQRTGTDVVKGAIEVGDAASSLIEEYGKRRLEERKAKENAKPQINGRDPGSGNGPPQGGSNGMPVPSAAFPIARDVGGAPTAQQLASLQAQINSLRAQVEALQQQVAQLQGQKK